MGGGPRAVQFLILGRQGPRLLQGRTYVTCEDVQALAKPVLRHRLVLSFTAESEGVTPDDLVERIVADHPHPRRRADTRCPIPEDFCILRRSSGSRGSTCRARHVVEGFLSGMHRSPYFGQSIEFRQHREYTYGDDLRLRRLESLGEAGPLLRQAVRGGHEPPLHAAVDVSASMRYGRGAMSKYEYGCTIAVSLAYLLLRQQDAGRLRRLRRRAPA